jgi:phosphoglycerate dehydrogenase-like enzyme
VIADQVLGYVVCFARNLHLYIRQQTLRQWSPIGGETQRVDFATGPGVKNNIDMAHAHLGEQTLGIIGLGEIGSEIARRAHAFNLRVLAIDPRRTTCPPEVAWVRTPDHLPELLAESDYVVVAAPHTPHTARLFRRQQFQQMKRTAYFINIGRGAIVNLDDLVAALEAKEIAGAALDVFEVEPLLSEHPLWNFPNVILTPHIAGYSPKIAERHFNLLRENVQRFVSGQPLLNVVDKSVWY